MVANAVEASAPNVNKAPLATCEPLTATAASNIAWLPDTTLEGTLLVISTFKVSFELLLSPFEHPLNNTPLNKPVKIHNGNNFFLCTRKKISKKLR